MSRYEDALTSLYQAPFADFVAERKRLAAELKTAGDKDDAARLMKHSRPPVSAWAVNQLWWQDRAAFEALIAAAADVKVGDREASRVHREALAKLRDRAASLLHAAGNAATEATLRRVTTTLSALGATGSFAPDPPGALAADRDPPGFEALGFGSSTTREVQPAADPSARRAAEAERRRAEAEAEQQRRAERERLSGELREAKALHASQHRELVRLRAEVEAAEQGLKQTQALLEQLERKLAAL